MADFLAVKTAPQTLLDGWLAERSGDAVLVANPDPGEIAAALERFKGEHPDRVLVSLASRPPDLEDAVDRELAVLHGVFGYLCGELLPDRGSVVVVTSTFGIRGSSGELALSVRDSGALTMVRLLAAERGPRFNAVAAGRDVDGAAIGEAAQWLLDAPVAEVNGTVLEVDNAEGAIMRAGRGE